MHELSVTESILNIAVRHARENGALKVTALHLVIGRFASIVDDSVQFYWDIISQDTLCAGSQLHFERIPGKLKCMVCGHEFILDDDLCPCPACGSPQARVISGDQFYLDSIEIEK